jgi:hypothetical protein|tara:strand:- start:40 stop:531 length:492 start_codon:yes stop_codon:yes gene_type:complete
MKRLLVIITLLTALSPSVALATESSFKMSVEALVTKSNETGDISYLGMAAIRCAALYNTYLTLVELNMDIKNDGAVAHSLYKLGVKIKAQKMQEHGAKESFIASMPEKAMEDIQKYSLVYWEWLKNNREATGDYAASSPEFIKEQEQCKIVYSFTQTNSDTND